MSEQKKIYFVCDKETASSNIRHIKAKFGQCDFVTLEGEAAAKEYMARFGRPDLLITDKTGLSLIPELMGKGVGVIIRNVDPDQVRPWQSQPSVVVMDQTLTFDDYLPLAELAMRNAKEAALKKMGVKPSGTPGGAAIAG